MTIANYDRAWILIVPLVPSIIVSIFGLYHFLINRALRKALNNHVIILLLINGLIWELTDCIWIIYLDWNLTVMVHTSAFCLAWVFIDSYLPVSIYILMAWASIERHILIFYPNWVATKTKRFFVHYLPSAICILWPLSFYFVMYIILPCNTTFNYSRQLCSRASCLASIPWATRLDSIVDYIMPAFITVSFSVALFLRVLYTRYRIRQRIDWKNYRKMAVQLLPISVLYITMQFPPMLLYAAYAGGVSRTVATSYFSDSLFFTYWVILFTPFATVISLPELKTKCRNLIFFWRKRRAVAPETMEMTRRNAGQTVAVIPVVQ